MLSCKLLPMQHCLWMQAAWLEEATGWLAENIVMAMAYAGHFAPWLREGPHQHILGQAKIKQLHWQSVSA